MSDHDDAKDDHIPPAAKAGGFFHAPDRKERAREKARRLLQGPEPLTPEEWAERKAGEQRRIKALQRMPPIEAP